ncbi:hypothetical protein KC352_g18566 [Hortaea werneckii]|nr:hypothetical protein KC358_g1178 [Hortaea werneckii]KAI6943727.1 hypothetical protein KC341_g1275 [Hortaea werneckii]KAI6945684.1 hypothetical protein KC348_g3656 [Hortaea werneckii]KAI6981723.1 hypothetical protein KC321_g1045 [Hortaea werneckii]KAI7025352.1 hypothetical protein KC362_g12063 [Hortaea werneckii]
MSLSASSFPNFLDGDVLIVLSDRTTDVVQLHARTLARCSAFFEASLMYQEWAGNKAFVSETGAPLKLLELAFDDHELLPTLVGRTSRTSAQEFRQQIDSYDEQVECREQEPEESRTYSPPSKPKRFLTPRRQTSATVILAHKILFAMVYDLEIDFDQESIPQMAALSNTIVDLADAYAMLPKFGIKIHHLLFSRDLGYKLIAECPYGMLRASCKLRSQVIYKEAMRHAVGLHAYTLELMEDANANARPAVFDYFTENNEPKLQEAFDEHVRVLRGKLRTLEKQLLSLEPDFRFESGVADSTTRAIATAILRDWIVKNMVSPKHCNHAGVLGLARREIPIAELVCRWSSGHWMAMVGQQGIRDDWGLTGHTAVGHMVLRAFGRIHEQALEIVHEIFPPTDFAKGQSDSKNLAGSDVTKSYVANITFDKDYKYPWQDAHPPASFSPFQSNEGSRGASKKDNE